MTDKRARLERLEDVARALGGIEHPDVVAWFDRTERNLMEDMVASNTDEDRRERAAYVRAFMDIRRKLYGATAEGERARRMMEEL